MSRVQVIRVARGLADNLITYAHTRGFLTEPRFVGAVLASHPEATERAIAWGTDTLCWAADSVSHLPGDYVECGTYQGSPLKY